MELDILEIKKLIPQRPPFLFLDSVQNVDEEGSSIVCNYLVKEDEYFFKGHFPENPIVPGVILEEMCFQAGAVLMSKSSNGSEKLGVITKVTNARFKGLVKPLDQLKIEVNKVDQIDNAVYFNGKILKDNRAIVRIEFTCAEI